MNVAGSTLRAAASRYIPGWVNGSQRAVGLPPRTPLQFVRAEGARVWDADGREYIDFHAAFDPIVLGHCDPGINAAAQAAVADLDVMGIGVTEAEVELARRLTVHVPSAERVLLCDSGTEATFHAVRLARAATGRELLIKFQGCYHGTHDYLLMNVISPAARVGQKDPGSAGIRMAGRCRASHTEADVDRALVAAEAVLKELR